jgi:hypothetical protein
LLFSGVSAAAAAELGRSAAERIAMDTKPAIVIGLSLVLASAVIALVPRFAPPSTSGNSEQADVKRELSQLKGEVADLKGEGKGAAPRPDLAVFEQMGTFVMIEGEAGAIGFPLPYAEPPAVEISEGLLHQRQAALITEITRSGFKWKCVGNTIQKHFELKWTAKGVKATRNQVDRR